MSAVVEVEDLRVELERGGVDVIDGISCAINEGEILGLVGESGSGKTTMGTALLGYARRGARIAHGVVRVGDREILALDSKRIRALRGSLVAYVPQDPSSALNPALRIGTQLREVLELHGRGQGADERIAEALREVKLSDAPSLLTRYPHQLSGGQQQRVCIAMAFLLRPRLVVLDEPTTGLDVTTQAHVLRTVRELAKSYGAAALYVTHDLAVVANLADRIMVLYAGRMAETGPRNAVFESPAHPYTARLLQAIPRLAERRTMEAIPGRAPNPGQRPQGCEFAPRCPAAIDVCHAQAPPIVSVGADHVARCHRASAHALSPVASRVPPVAAQGAGEMLSVHEVNASYAGTPVLHDVSLDLQRGECLALVGESGSGKTTLARCVIGLHAEWSGTIGLEGRALQREARDRSPEARQALQYIFQSPYSSLNPRKTIHQTIEVPLRHFHGMRGAVADARIRDAIEQVALSERVLGCYPDQLSGGERQRVAIARALACEPQVLICDEVTSALDVSVQAAIVEVLRGLQLERQLTMLFVTHDLALVRSIADRIVVMNQGRIVQVGVTDALIDAPQDDYTRNLLANTPSVEAAAMTADGRP